MVNENPTSGDRQGLLASARAGGKPWFELARTIESALSAMPANERVDGVASLARAEGISPAVAKRYVRLLAKMREISREMQVGEDDLLVRSFNSQEIAARIYSNNKLAGEDLLLRLSRRQIGFLQLKEIQARNTEPSAASLRSKIAHLRSTGASAVEVALRKDGDRIFGEGFRTRRRPKLRFVGGNTGHEIIGPDGSIIAGVDVIVPDDRLGHDALDRNIGRSLLLAQFFPKFYVAFPSSAEIDVPRTRSGQATSERTFDCDMVSRTIELLDWFRYDWIGVLVAVGDSAVKEIRSPTGSPVPDMTSRYESYVRAYCSAPADNPFRRK